MFSYHLRLNINEEVWGRCIKYFTAKVEEKTKKEFWNKFLVSSYFLKKLLVMFLRFFKWHGEEIATEFSLVYRIENFIFLRAKYIQHYANGITCKKLKGLNKVNFWQWLWVCCFYRKVWPPTLDLAKISYCPLKCFTASLISINPLSMTCELPLF